jgi:hypothetical protein
MPRSSTRGRSSSNRSSSRSNDWNDWGVTEMVRERPIAAAATAAGAAAAGLFLWSKRAQISNQLSTLSDQIGEWTSQFQSSGDDTGGLTTPTATTASRNRGMSETGGGNASLGRRSGGGGVRSTASGRGRAQSTAATQQ